LQNLRKFNAEVNKLRRMGDGAVTGSRIAHGENAQFRLKPLEIPHAFGDGVVSQYTAKRGSDGDAR
jgi:hypothetical protein